MIYLAVPVSQPPHLECKPHVPGIHAQPLNILIVGAAHDGARHHRRLQQRRRLVLMDVA